MTLPVHIVTELKKHVDKPVKHWHHLHEGDSINWPVENKLLLMKMFSGKYFVGTWSNYNGFQVLEGNALGERVVKWMYIPEDE